MLRVLLSKSLLRRRGKFVSVTQIASRLDALETDFCSIVSDLALISRNTETREKMPTVQIAADGNLAAPANTRRLRSPAWRGARTAHEAS